MRELFSLVVAGGLLTACALSPTSTSTQTVDVCGPADAARQQFDIDKDLLVSNFDLKPDLDDVHAIAALASVVRSDRYKSVDYIAVIGAYGTQKKGYVDVPEFAQLAFGENWADAHNDHAEAITKVGSKIKQTLDAGGTVWVQEAGQSDFTNDVMKSMAGSIGKDVRKRVKVVQHSLWNENKTTSKKLFWVNGNLSYVRIQDGNSTGNGTPGFATMDGAAWPTVKANSRAGDVWAQADEISKKYNPIAPWVNPKIEAGGFDFSDTVELAYILGFDGMEDHNDFFQCFVD